MGLHTNVLYHGLASTCSKKVRMALFEKGVTFESHLLDLQKFEQHDPSYLAINPNGVVPTLVHDGRPVTESSVIILFIEDVYPDPPLTPRDPHDRATMRLWMKYSDETAYEAVYAPTWHKLRHRAEAGLDEHALSGTLSRVPTLERKERWAKMANGGFTHEELEVAYEKMRELLARTEARLQRSPWLAGDQFSLADIAMLPFVDRIKNLRPEFLEGDETSAVRTWLESAAKRPAFARAMTFTEDPRAAELPNI